MTRVHRLYKHIRQFIGGWTDQRIFFLHIPKCGGTSIDRAIRMAYGIRANLRQSGFFHLDPHASRRSASLMQVPLMKHREHLLLYMMEKPDVHYISGHFCYSNRAHQKHGDTWEFVTVLRHPVDKWFSQYFYNRYKKSTHFGIDADLESYIESEEGRALGKDFIAKLTQGVPPQQLDSAEAIDCARRNLDTFAVVGVLEHVDRFAEQFEERFGVRLYIGRENQNPVSKNVQTEQVSPAILDRVWEICQPDLAVYRHALHRLDLPIEAAEIHGYHG